tara:strand:+ start:1361 stop:1735 length:375 start_codon:yes stop_codon:yes gene_type:complete
MGFKLGSENRKLNYGSAKNRFNKDDASVPGTPVIRKNLESGIKAEANIDGSIFLDKSVVPGSQEERAVLMHEMRHIVDMKTGKLSYTDNDLTWMGETHERKDGQINFEGKWYPEGHHSLPWEKH